MIKRILVALDADSDTYAAVQYASDIAKRFQAEITGLAVVDLDNISAETRGSGIGSMYYAEKLRDRLTEETRHKARQLLEEFEQALAGAGVEHSYLVEEGVPFQRIVEDMKYHDLLVVGKEPHFFYGSPEQKTETLVRVVAETIAPTLVVGEAYEPVDRVLIAYDGSPASARTLQSFTHLQPFGTEIELELLHIHEDSAEESALLLEFAQTYLRVHGLKAQTNSMRGNHPAEQIADYARTSGADVIVSGARPVSGFRKWAFGSTTASLLEDTPRPLFLQR